MGNLFGKPKEKKSRVSDHDRAVLELKKQRDKLKQYQKKIHVQLEKDRQVAKKLLTDGKKEKALLLLRKKKYQESMLEKTDNQLDNIERLVGDLEFAQVEQQVINGLKKGNESLKKMHELMSLEDVEKIMSETEEAVEYQNEIDSLLSGSLTAEDESDVLEELQGIIRETKGDPVITEEDVQLPDVPTEDIQGPEPARARKSKRREEDHQEEAMLAS